MLQVYGAFLFIIIFRAGGLPGGSRGAAARAGKDCGVKVTLNTVHHRDGNIFCQSHKPYDKPTSGLRS